MEKEISELREEKKKKREMEEMRAGKDKKDQLTKQNKERARMTKTIEDRGRTMEKIYPLPYPRALKNSVEFKESKRTTRGV